MNLDDLAEIPALSTVLREQFSRALIEVSVQREIWLVEAVRRYFQEQGPARAEYWNRIQRAYRNAPEKFARYLEAEGLSIGVYQDDPFAISLIHTVDGVAQVLYRARFILDLVDSVEAPGPTG